MPISCVPADLAAAAKCFDGLDAIQRESIKLYELAQIAGLGSLTPAQLAANAKCFSGLASDHVMAKATEIYLLCQAVNK